MSEITEKDVKRLWVEKGAICVELNDGRIGRELIRDYEPLRRLRENSWRTSALIAMACGLTIWTRAWNFRDSFRRKRQILLAAYFGCFPN